MFETSLITLIGAIIAALGTIWQTYQGNQYKSELKTKIKLKSFLPSIILFLGALIVAFSVWLSSVETNKKDKIINEKNDKIMELSDSILSRSKVIEKLNTELKISNDRITTLNQNAINSITGGDSFAYIVIVNNILNGKATLLLIHKGQFPIYDLDIRIVDLDKFHNPNISKITEEKRNEWLEGTRIHVGNLIPGFASEVIIPWEEVIPGKLFLNVFFAARNGAYIQLYRRLKIKDNGFAEAIKVKKQNGKTIFKEITNNFPQNILDEDADWNH